MDEQLEFILDRVARHDSERQPYKDMAEKWVRMWKLDPGFTKPLAEAISKGLEQVILPTPFNVVNLSQRLLSTTPRINVIPQDVGNKESEEYAEQCEKWLMAMWRVVNRQQRRNILADNIWYSLVYGRFVFDVRWIKDMLPPLLRKTAFPISIRTLNPVNVGIQQGPYCTEFAYHKYEATLLEVLRRWPDLKEADSSSKLGLKIAEMGRSGARTEDEKVCVIDYWATDPDEGWVGNGVLVEDEFAKPYKNTSYPYIPIIAGRGDYAVGLGDEFDGLSILHSIDGLWQYQCRLASQMATGLLWYFWPEFLVSNENGHNIDDVQIGPGLIEPVPPGTKVDQVTMNPNVPLAQAVYSQLEGYVQQSTYPEVMYGQAPGELQAGYGVSLLSDAAKGRIKNFQESLEMALVHVNELVLALVEKKGGKAGVDIYGVSERNNEKYRLNLNKKMINGVYHNDVRIAPALPIDDMQRVVQGTQLANSKYISAQTLRDKYLGVEVPTDETRRITLEEAMQSDELRPYRLRRALEEYFGKEAYTIMFGTDLMPPPPEGYEWVMGENGKVELKKAGPQMPPGGGPEQGGSGGMPPMGGPMPPPGGPPLQPEATLVPPMGGGIPPVLQGQLEGESLGLPQAGDPLMLDMALNTMGSPNEQMRMAAGLPPEGPIV